MNLYWVSLSNSRSGSIGVVIRKSASPHEAIKWARKLAPKADSIEVYLIQEDGQDAKAFPHDVLIKPEDLRKGKYEPVRVPSSCHHLN